MRLRCSRGVPLPVQARADRGRDAVRVSCPQPREGRVQELAATVGPARHAAFCSWRLELPAGVAAGAWCRGRADGAARGMAADAAWQ